MKNLNKSIALSILNILFVFGISLGFASCNGNAQDTKETPNSNDSIENVKETSDTIDTIASAEEENNNEISFESEIYGCDIREFREKIFPNHEIKLPKSTKSPSVLELANAFAQSLDGVLKVEDLIDKSHPSIRYLTTVVATNPKQFKKYNKEYEFYYYDLKLKKDFLHVYDAHSVDMMYHSFKHKNGHTIFVVNWSKECDCAAYIIVFYDYNPKTNIMKSCLQATTAFEKKYGGMNDTPYNVFGSLGEEGIEIGEEIKLKWNGETFVKK